jgi:small-conductance mechanosensitive channel
MVSYCMTNFLSRLSEFALGRGLRLAGILLLAFVLTRLSKSLTRRIVYKPAADGANRAARMREQQTKTVAELLDSVITFVIVAVAILMAMREFGYDVTPVAAAAGLASLAVGFGAQNLIRDLIAGLFVVIEDQYVVGDTVRIGQTTGRVEHITLRRTVLRDDQGAIVTIPNGQVQQVANLSRDWSQVFLGVTVAPDSPLEAPLAVLERVAADFRADADWSAALVDGPRVLGVDAIGPAGAKILLQVRTAATRQDDVARELRRRVSAAFEKEGIRTSGVQRVELQFVGQSTEQYAAKQEEIRHG